jgi:hypothetical protein
MGIDSYVKLMLHCNGADASTSFPDDSPSGHTVTAQNSAQVDTAQSKFGGAAALFVDTTSDYLEVADSDDWYLSTDDFTIDFWLRLAATGQAHGLVQQFVDDDNRWALLYSSFSNGLLLYAKSGGSLILNVLGTWYPSADTWYHVEIGRSGTAFKWFVDGTALSISGTPDADAIPQLAAALQIGRYDSTSSYYLDGWIDELRVSKGICRHTSNFTPPSAEYAYFADPAYLRRAAYPIDRVPRDAVVW